MVLSSLNKRDERNNLTLLYVTKTELLKFGYHTRPIKIKQLAKNFSNQSNNYYIKLYSKLIVLNIFPATTYYPFMTSLNQKDSSTLPRNPISQRRFPSRGHKR